MAVFIQKVSNKKIFFFKLSKKESLKVNML